MAFDGSYPRHVREAGTVHRVFIRRAHCRPCGTGDALLPDFVLRHRRDSAVSVGAAVLAHAGAEVPQGASGLYEGVPLRTVRSWRQRFSERADELAVRLEALGVEWGASAPLRVPHGTSTPSHRAVLAMGTAWRAARRRHAGPIPAAWLLANVIVGSQLLSTRVDLPWPIVASGVGRSRSPELARSCAPRTTRGHPGRHGDRPDVALRR